MRRALALVLAAGLGVGLGACGGDSGDSSSSGGSGTGSGATTASDELVVKTSEFAFDPKEVTIAAGRDYTLVLDNSKGSVEHDWLVEGTDIKVLAPPKGKEEGTVRMDQPGTYTIYCSIAGHREAGMEGTLTVTS